MSFIKVYGRCYQKFDNNPIIKTDPTYIAPTAKENLKYTGEEQALLNAGSTDDGTIKYSLDGTNWSANVPTGTEAQTYTVYWKLEGDANHNDVEQASISVEITQSHDYVEIGGLRWATMNIGANSITDTGLYFQWGDTQGYTAAQVGNGEGKKYFNENDCIYYNDGSYTKYNETDSLITLESTDDAVTAAWGGNWRMPTIDEFEALKYAVDYEWTDDYEGSGVAGLVCTDNTDNSKILFFPACGCATEGDAWAVGSYGRYCSSSLDVEDVDKALYLNFHEDDVTYGMSYDRYEGCPVRAVQSAS